ncbi:MAG: efflux RND transporter periplasmic adaptor subunit [Deltaproteobacteria bacterium]|nr:efflux RND transporter periplasmic adaptor subunit [Deltaproteobacteria bacterium]
MEEARVMTTDHKQDRKRMRIWQKLVAGVLLLALIGLVVFFGAHRIQERLKSTPPVPRPPLAVETMQVDPGPFTVTRPYTGSIVATRRALISARVSARVKRVRYREGETVKKGNLLITLDDRDLRAEVGRLEATARRIQADLDYWMLQTARDEKLLRGKAIPFQKRDESKRMVASLEASLHANEYALAAARAKLDYTLIRAPFSGAIQRLDTEVGELATPGKVLLELVATRPLKAVFSVPQQDLAEIREGMEVRLIVPSPDKTITSRIDHIYPALDSGTRNATFEARLTKHLGGLRPGMTVDGMVVLAKFERALVLPRSAVRIREGGTGVYTVEKNVARWRPVTIGQAQGKQVRIVSGLKGGETVILTPDPRLQGGSRVQPRNNWRTAP